MSGEILRAVLDQSCQFAAPVFYEMESPVFVAAGPRQALTSQFETKADRYFLWTGVGTSKFNPSFGVFDNSDALFEVRLLRSSRVLYQTLAPQLYIGEDMQQMFTFPTYILINPNETLSMTVEATPDAVADYRFGMTMIGIEYAR